MHLYIARMDVLCKLLLFFIVFFLFLFFFSGLLLLLLLRVCVYTRNTENGCCVCVCVCVCVSLSLRFPPPPPPPPPQYIRVLLCLWTIFAYDYLVYCIHYHKIAVRCTKNGIKHGEKTKQNLRQFFQRFGLIKIGNVWKYAALSLLTRVVSILFHRL